MLTQDAKRLGIHKSQNTPAAKKARGLLKKAEKGLTDAQAMFDAARLGLEGLAEDAADKVRDTATKSLADAESALVDAVAKVASLKK